MNPKYLLVAVAALSLGACTKDDTHTETVTENRGHKISFTIAEDSETRTTLGKDNEGRDILRWVATDQVGIYTVGQNVNSNTVTVADVNQSTVEFIGVLENSVSEGDKFYAYYPYDEAQSTDPAAVQLTIPAEQTQSEAGVYNGQSHPLAAVPMELKSDACRINNVLFRLLGAIVELQIYSSDETLRGEKIHTVKFVSDAPLAGDFTFDLTGVTVDKEPQIEGCESTEVKTILEKPVTIPATKDEAARIYLTIAPGEYTGQIVVETGITQYTFRLAEAMNFKRAVIKGLPADLAEATRELDPDASIQFADTEVERICVGAWDTNGDGELSYQEAAAVTEIGEQFMQNESISNFNELQYFTGLRSIEYAFSNCKSLTSIHIPDGVMKIGQDAFYRCSSLTSVHLPDGLTTIGDCAFSGCSSLESIHIPDAVTLIGLDAFYNCGSLTSITIPDGVTTIGALAFSGCSSLTSVNIPQAVSFIGEGAFEKCPSLYAFSGKYASEDKRCLIQDNGTLLAFAPAGRTEYTIPNRVTAIGDSVFKGCSNLTSIHIPEGVTTIEESAFNGCSGLMSINIPDDVTSIGNGAFRNCSGLTEIHIPAGVTAIEFEAFRGCSSLTTVYCKPNTPPDLGNSVFLLTSSSMIIYVPAASVDDYEEAEGWREYTIVADDNQSGPNETDPIPFEDLTVMEICYNSNWDTNGDGELSYKEAAAVTDLGAIFQNATMDSFNELQYFTGLTTIEADAFFNCNNLTSIQLPDGLTSIGDRAFIGCCSLLSINIPNGVTKIGEHSFGYCTGLKSIAIPDTVTAIGNAAFMDCSSLTSINIPDGVTAIGYSAFSNCSSLTELIIPNGVTAIENSTFWGCSSLTEINIPTGVTTIGDYAFKGCSSLESITIPTGVTAIGYSAFENCSSLKNITIPTKVTKIGHNTFSECSSLTEIHIPAGVTAIEFDAFRKCSSLKSVYCKPTTPPNLGNGVFFLTPSDMKIYVPAGSVEEYIAADRWSTYASQIEEDNSSTED